MRQQLARVTDLRKARGRRWALPRVLETVLGALVLQIHSGHRLDERTRTGFLLEVPLRLSPIPKATLQWILPQLDVTEVREVLIESVGAEVRRKSVVTPAGALRTLAIDGKCLWRGRRGGCPACQRQGEVRVHRVMQALLTSACPRLLVDQCTLGAEENEMGAFAAF